MKIRNGFVSNSSSSSYMVGIGRIPEGTVLDKLIHIGSGKIISGAQLIKESKNKWSSISVHNGMITVSGGGNNGCDASIPFDPDKDANAWFYMVNINNNEGDNAFYVDAKNEDYDLDYDIDLSWFDGPQQKAYKQFASFESSEVFYGAERNG